MVEVWRRSGRADGGAIGEAVEIAVEAASYQS